MTFTLDRQISTGKKGAGRQLIVEATVQTKANGSITVDVQSYFEGSGGKNDRQEDLQSLMVLSKGGDIMMGDPSDAVMDCLAR